MKGSDWHIGDWMQTYTGRQFWPQNPDPEDVDPRDIAHSLSMQCRYNGHVDYFYSVAEHCVLMSNYVPEEFALWALLHDATEAYVGDMIKPIKRNMPEFSAMEDRVMQAIATKFGLKLEWDMFGWDLGAGVLAPKVIMPGPVREADERILLTERNTLMSGKPPAAWPYDHLEPLPVVIRGWEPDMAERMYLVRLAELGVEV